MFYSPILQEMFGVGMLDRTIVVFTHADSLLGPQLTLDSFLDSKGAVSTLRRFLEKDCSMRVLALNNRAELQYAHRKQREHLIGMILKLQVSLHTAIFKFIRR